MKKSDKDYMARVAEIPCLVCGETEVELHHVRRFGETRKVSQVVPLCVYHHRAGGGIHHLGQKKWEREFYSQDELLEMTKERLK